MSKRGLPADLKMRHDWHYVEELAKIPKTVGKMIAVEKIDPNPEQPRTEIGDLSELTASIKDRGVLEPLLVKPLGAATHNTQRWLIIAGERRWRAARQAGLTEVPCVELDVDAAQIAEIALIENLQRKDLNAWEEADGLAALCQRFGYTHEDVARRIGKSRSTVTESLTIASLPNHIRKKCQDANLTAKSTILQIARQFDEPSMLAAIASAAKGSGQSNSNASSRQSEEGKIQPRINLGNPTSHRSARESQKTDLSAPVRAYSYHSPDNNYKLALKFKKPVDKNDIIQSLRQIIAELEDD